MVDDEWMPVDRVQGQVQAEIMKGLLEAQGLRVWLNQEGLAHSYAVSVGTIGMVEILVPASELEQAKTVLEAYYRGDFEDSELNDPELDNPP